MVSKWRPIMLVKAYRMLRLGMSEVDVCKELGITRKTWFYWCSPDSVDYKLGLDEAVAMAKRELAANESLPAWIYSRLSPSLQKLWDKIESWGEAGESGGVAKIEMMLQDHGKRVRQQLFLHALCVCRFSPSHALAKVNIPKGELDRWISEDPDFALMVEEVEWHKGNFFEESLVALVQNGDTAAVLFANKTYNAKRGYGTRAQVDVNVSGGVVHGVVDLTELYQYLSESAKLELLDAIRKRDHALTLTQRQLSPSQMIGADIARSVDPTP